MNFGELLKGISDEWRVVENAPISFAVSVLLAALLLWRLLDWYYKGSIRSLEDRLKLRDDEIAQLSRSLARGGGNISPVKAEPEDDSSIGVELPSLPNFKSPLMPWMTNTPMSERSFLPTERTAQELLSIFDGVTSAQGKLLAEPYIGKWISVIQTVADVDRREDHDVVLSFMDDYPGRFIWLHFKIGVDLATVRKGDSISVTGRIEELKFGSLRLYECELNRSH